MLTGRLLFIALSALSLASFVAAEDKVCTLPDNAGKYVLSLPKDYDPKKEYELIVALHGSGDPPEHFVKALRSLMPARDCILAAPYSQDVRGWSSTDSAVIKATLTDAQQMCRVNKERVLLLGFSAGDAAGFLFIAQHPMLVAGFAGFADAVSTTELSDEDLAAAKSLPVFYSVGTKDPCFAASAETEKTLKRLGFTYLYDTPSSVGHTLTPAQLKRCFDWFDDAFKKKAVAESAGAAAQHEDTDSMTIRERPEDEVPRTRPKE